MNQLRIAGIKRKPDELLFPSAKLESFKQTNRHFEADRPCTPYPMLMKTRERSMSFNKQDDTLEEVAVKKRRIVGEEGIATTSPHLISFPSLDSSHAPVGLCYGISSTELKRASESILNQVNWSKVVLDAIGKEKPTIFRQAFKEILQAHIEKLLKQEDKQKSENVEDPDIESGDDSSEDKIGNESEHSDNETFLQSDMETEYGSEDYHEDEDEDEEDDDDYQEDEEDYEVIADGTSV